MHDRRTVGVVLIAALLATSGCLGLLTGETATFEASQTTVSDATLEQSEYELANESTQNATRNFTVAGQERTVRITNHVVQYERTVSLGPLGEQELARFAVVATPAVELAGRTFNPVGEWSEKRIVEEFTAQYSGLSDVDHVDDRTVRSLGDERSVAKFSGRATAVGDRTIDVTLHVTRFEHGEDFVVAVAVHPTQLSDESDRVDGLIRGLTH